MGATAAATPAAAGAGAAAAATGAAGVALAGALAGVLEGLSIQPLELLKTRAQIHAGPSPLTMRAALGELLREGGPRQLYRGALPEISGLMPRAAAALTTLEFAQRGLRAASADGRTLSAGGAYLAGGMSGVSEAFAFSPFQVIKVRLMAKAHLGRYANTWDCLRKTLAAEGPAALATGLAPTLYRNCIWNALFYGARGAARAPTSGRRRRRRSAPGGIEACCRRPHPFVLIKRPSPPLPPLALAGTMHEVERRLPPASGAAAGMARSAALGTCVGVAATVFNVPFDVVRPQRRPLPGRCKRKEGEGGRWQQPHRARCCPATTDRGTRRASATSCRRAGQVPHAEPAAGRAALRGRHAGGAARHRGDRGAARAVPRLRAQGAAPGRRADRRAAGLPAPAAPAGRRWAIGGGP